MIRDTIDTFYRMLHARKFAYNAIFPKNSKLAQDVLKDLAKFCRAHESTFHQDPRMHAVLEGRREVWLRIQEHLNFTVDEIYDLHRIKEFKPEGK